MSSTSRIKIFLNQLKSLLLTASAVLIISSAVIEASIVPTSSMEKTILVGDRLLINKFIFGASTPTYIPFTNIEIPYLRLPSLKEPERNEILVFRFPGDKDQLKHEKVEFWVKRCIGLPGDTVQIKNKVVFVNGKISPIPFNILYRNQPVKNKDIKSKNIFPITSDWNEDNYGPIIIPKKGDIIDLDTSNIMDWRVFINREFGREAVDIENDIININGEAASSYKISKNYYFIMGDNRDDSYDSRHWGFVPRENIAGTPILVFWSWDSGIPFSRPLELFSSIRLNRIAKLIN